MPYVPKRAYQRKRGKNRLAKRKVAFRRKKIYKRGYRKGGLTTARIKGTQVVADRYFCKLKYVHRQTNVTLNATTQSNYSDIIRGNSLYDPEYIAGGGQPTGFDYLKTMYAYYRVHASSVNVRIFNHSSTANGGYVYLTVYPDTKALAPSATSNQWSDVAGLPHARHKLIPCTAARFISHLGLRHKMKSKTVLGSKTIMNTDHECSVSQNPSDTQSSATRAWYWIITIWNADQSTTSVTYTIDVEQEFYCEFMRPNPMPDTVLYGDPDGTNDPTPSQTGIFNTYQPAYGGSGSTSIWVGGPN